MIEKITFEIPELNSMKKYPNKLFFIGNTQLLKKKKVAIVGTRRPTNYTKEFTHKIAKQLSNANICVVSGAAMGVDAIAHKAAGEKNTIAVVANGLDIKYPAVNKKMISSIEKDGLVLSAYELGEKARKYTFVHRNEIVVALSDILIVTQADLNSGSLTSVEYALKMNKKVYTIPHRIGESLGTSQYVKKGLIEPIYDIDMFMSQFKAITVSEDEDLFLQYCKTNPIFEEAILRYSNKVFEYELEGKIEILNGRIRIL